MTSYTVGDEPAWTVGKDKPIVVNDQRDDLPIFVHSELDDAPITSDAFRVYAHLARRRNAEKGYAWPSYKSMGGKCFGADYPEASELDRASLRRRAMRAVIELEFYKLIEKQPSEHHPTNEYKLTPKREWDFSKRYVYVADPSKKTWDKKPENDHLPSDTPSLVIGDHPPSDTPSLPSDTPSPKGTLYKGTTKEGALSKPVSPLATTGRAFSPAPKPGRTKRYDDSENEYVPEGEEHTSRQEATPIELLIGQLTGMKHFSATNKRKMYDPVGVLFGGTHITEGSPAEELEKYPYEFAEWVKARNTFLKQNGGTSTAKLLQSIRNGYDTEKYGWLARRPKPVTSPTDPNAPWM